MRTRLALGAPPPPPPPPPPPFRGLCLRFGLLVGFLGFEVALWCVKAAKWERAAPRHRLGRQGGTDVVFE